MTKTSWTTLLLALGLGGCSHYHHPVPSDAKQTLKEAQKAAVAPLQVPEAVNDELLPSNPMLPVARPQVAEQRFRVAAKEVEASDFFGSLMRDSRYSVAVHPGVSGRITLELRDVTLPEVLDTVSSLYGYDIERKGNVYHVYPAGLRTETLPINYLMMTRQGLSRTTINSGRVSDQGSSNTLSSSDSSSSSSSSSSNSGNTSNTSSANGTSIETDTKTDFWTELQTTLQKLVGSGDGRMVQVNPQAGLVTLRAMPADIRAVKAYLNQSEQHLKRQVILEAKILEVTLNEGYEQGVQWDNFSISAGATALTGGSLVAIPTTTNTIGKAIGGGASFLLSDGTFSAVINMLKTQGDVSTLSSPRVTAINNQKAVIKVGSDEYFVTDVSTTTVTGTSTTSSPDVELTPFFSGIALDVTPQIDDDGKVLLHVHPSVIDVTEQQKTIDLGDDNTLTLPLAYSDIRESDTVVEAKSGDIIVIGGLMRTNKEQQVSKVPLLGDIPFLGQAFTNRKDVNTKTELVIMLKPQVVESNTWQQELQRSSALLDKWYPEAK
ncbi:pilus (MSHA type) biogenesis protein MshL [Pseudaeromonas sp. ZJS20]|uniref:pilus (MSHA type) biogenesis protein MshL n=1 Tax=Pseudaeromonas aegiceratis TaxID=3153928 RepID=UPI00390C66E8